MTPVRQATVDDVDAMQIIRGRVRENRLENMVIPSADVIKAISETGRGWVAVESENVVGFSIANGQDGSIWALFVDPDFDRRGHGHGLHEAAVNWLFEQGFDPLRLTTDPGTRAEGFYISRGWRVVGVCDNGEVRLELSRDRWK